MDQFIRDIPPITLTYMAGAFLTTAACSLELISPFSLYLNFRMVFTKFQFWRLITNFLFFGAKFSLDFVFHMFFLVRYCKTLEESSFRGRTADFFYMVLFGATTMTLLAPLLHMQFLGSSLTFMMVYVWARRNPWGRMNFLGVFNFTAPYLPWVLVAFSMALGSDGVVDLVGIAVGHIYYFAEDVYPRMIPTRTRILKTPRFIERLFGVNPPPPPAAAAVPFPVAAAPVAAPAAADAADAAVAQPPIGGGGAVPANIEAPPEAAH